MKFLTSIYLCFRSENTSIVVSEGERKSTRTDANLAHEVGDDAVEGGALEVEGLSLLPRPLLTRAQRTEVLRRLRRRVREELCRESD